MVIHLYFILIPILLVCAALFAATEAAVFSLSRTQLQTLKSQKPGLHRIITQLIRKPDAFLSTVIIGNECINILIGIFVTTLLEMHFHNWDPKVLISVSVLLSSLLLLTISEIFPKVVAFRLPVLVASILVPPASVVHFMLKPLRRVFLSISGAVMRKLNVVVEPPKALTEKDLLTLVELGAESGSLDKEEKDMIFNVFHFSDLPVSAVMTPWKKVFFIHDNTSVSDTLALVRENTFSRVPVISHKDGHMAGILYTKELLKLLLAPELIHEEEALKKAIFHPYFVSTHKKVSKLFREFKVKKVHIAIVVDEYGRHLGVVTLEDVLNSLFRARQKPEAGVS